MPTMVSLLNRSYWSNERTHVPADHDDLFRVYFPFIVNLVQRQGIDRVDAEDVAMTILAKFIEKGALEDFDPEYVTETKGVIVKAVFRTFLSGFVCTYVQHYRNMQGKRLRREPFSGDRNYGGVAKDDSAATQTWFELNAPPVEDHIEQDEIDGDSTIAHVRRGLALVPPTNAADNLDMVALFDAMLVQYDDLGRTSPTLLAEQFGVSKTTVQAWLKRLRPQVSALLAA